MNMSGNVIGNVTGRHQIEQSPRKIIQKIREYFLQGTLMQIFLYPPS